MLKQPEYKGERCSWTEDQRLRCDDCRGLAIYQANEHDVDATGHTHLKEVYLCETHLQRAIKNKRALLRTQAMPKYREYLRKLQKWTEKSNPQSDAVAMF